MTWDKLRDQQVKAEATLSNCVCCKERFYPFEPLAPNVDVTLEVWTEFTDGAVFGVPMCESCYRGCRPDVIESDNGPQTMSPCVRDKTGLPTLPDPIPIAQGRLL